MSALPLHKTELAMSGLISEQLHSVLTRPFGWCSSTWIVMCTTWMTMESNYSPLGDMAVWELALKWVLTR